MKGSLVLKTLLGIHQKTPDDEKTTISLSNVRKKIRNLVNRVSYDFDNKVVDYDISSEWHELTDSVSAIECVLNGKECTVINMILREGSFISKHKHKRAEEIFVVSGEIIDDVNDVVTSEGNVYTIPLNKSHSIRSDYAKLTVVYRPPFPIINKEKCQSQLKI